MWLLLACTAPAPDVPAGEDVERVGDDVERVGGGTDPAEPDAADVFDFDTVHEIALTMDAADWAEVSGNPTAETWVEADFSWDGETVPRIGLRAFGYSSHVVGKPPLKLDFDRVTEGQEWRGLESLKLRNAYLDPSFLHDALAAWMLREAGVPASRTGWARVSVNGEDVGLYTVMEPVDDRFLERVFGNDDGPLYSIDGIRGHGLMPLDDALAYFQYNTSVTGDGSDLEDLTRIVAEGTDEELAAVVDLDAFFVESVTRTLSGSQDAFSADGNNFYLYNDPGEDADPGDLHGTWRVIPWDFNFDFTSFGVLPAMEVDPWRPWATSDYAYDPYSGEPYEDRLMMRQIAAGRDVDAQVRELAEGPLAFPRLLERVEAWRALLADEVATDPLGGAEAFRVALANDLLYLHLRLSTELGEEVAECAAMEAGATPAAEMAPTGTVGWSELTADGWVWSGQSVCGDACIGFDVAGEHFCTGLFAHAPSSVTLTVPQGATRLRGAVGLQAFGSDCSGGAQFRVVQGGVTRWESGVLGSYDEAEDLDVPVDAGEVTLVTDPLADYSCDTTAWLDLRAVP